MKFLIETDHKPLVPLLGSSSLDSLPPRVLRFRLRMGQFNYDIVHVPGKLLYTADALSRAPSLSSENDSRLEEEAEALLEVYVNHLPAGKERVQEFRKYQAQDQVCSAVIAHCREGWPRRGVTAEPKPYWQERGRLTVDGSGLLLHGKRVVIPKTLRKERYMKDTRGFCDVDCVQTMPCGGRDYPKKSTTW